MATVAIIGAGQLGSRHLQSLKMLNIPIDICVVEPRSDAAEIAMLRWAEGAEASSSALPPSPRFLNSISQLPGHIDLAIVATTSRVRFEVIQELFRRTTTRFLVLEKVLFQNPEQYEQFAEMTANREVTTYVNCPRRMYGFYQTLRKQFAGKPITFEVTGGEWGLGCNAIHFLDLFVFLAADRVGVRLPNTDSASVRITEECLDPVIYDARRNGYVEFCGEICGELVSNLSESADSIGHPERPAQARDRPQARFRIASEHGNAAPHSIRIHDAGSDYRIQESNGTICTMNARGETISAGSFDVPLQSQLTRHVVEDLLLNGSCALPLFNESRFLHLELLHCLLRHYQITKDKNALVCPIT